MRLRNYNKINFQSTKSTSRMIELIPVDSVQDGLFDAVIIVADGINSLNKLDQKCPELRPVIEKFSKEFHSLDKGGVSLIHACGLPFKRIIYSNTGPIHGDFDDVRRYTKAGIAAGEKTLPTGARSPLLITLPSERFPNAQLASAVGLLHSLYTPLIIRECDGGYVKKVDLLGILQLETPTKTKTTNPGPCYAGGSLAKVLQAIQSSFDLCRDIGDGDPQRMCPARVANYVRMSFGQSESAVKISVLDDDAQIGREYPLLAAVSRCANSIEEHKARLIWLEYDGGGEPSETLFLVGKGVTIDTGGADLKVGGAMCGMSRDKYGSAVVAGFFKALDAFRPTGIKAIGCMCMCRNSIGSNAYTCDEIITSRSGKRVHINNTDAEGRLAMADPLTEFRERACKAKNPHLLTVATLTGHAVLAYGHCAAVIQNGPARAVNYAEQLQKSGDSVGQPLEVSRLSTEDFDFHSAHFDGADLRQADNKPSVQTPRGHQGPAAFLIRVSRLDECGMDSGQPIKYTHLDIGYSMGAYPQSSLPAPLLALIGHHILPKVKFP